MDHNLGSQDLGKTPTPLRRLGLSRSIKPILASPTPSIPNNNKFGRKTKNQVRFSLREDDIEKTETFPVKESKENLKGGKDKNLNIKIENSGDLASNENYGTPINKEKSKPRILKTVPVVKVAERHWKHNLSLTITPDKRESCQKRKLDLSENEPKKPKLSAEKDLKNHIMSYRDSDQVKDDQEKSSIVNNMISKPISDIDKSICFMLKELEKKRKKLIRLKALSESNQKTKESIQLWTEAGTRALEALSSSHDPPHDISKILKNFGIPCNLFGFDPKTNEFLYDQNQII